MAHLIDLNNPRPLTSAQEAVKRLQELKIQQLKGTSTPEFEQSATSGASEALAGVKESELRFPGRASGGTGSTGLGRHDRAGFQDINADRVAGQRLTNFLGGGSAEPLDTNFAGTLPSPSSARRASQPQSQEEPMPAQQRTGTSFGVDAELRRRTAQEALADLNLRPQQRILEEAQGVEDIRDVRGAKGRDIAEQEAGTELDVQTAADLPGQRGLIQQQQDIGVSEAALDRGEQERFQGVAEEGATERAEITGAARDPRAQAESLDALLEGVVTDPAVRAQIIQQFSNAQGVTAPRFTQTAGNLDLNLQGDTGGGLGADELSGLSPEQQEMIEQIMNELLQQGAR